jgi:hypothetical protein
MMMMVVVMIMMMMMIMMIWKYGYECLQRARALNVVKWNYVIITNGKQQWGHGVVCKDIYCY